MPSPEFQTVLQMLSARPALEAPTVEQMRAGLETISVLFQVPPDVRCEPTDADGIAAEWIAAPETEAGRVVLYLHGGGYVMGSINSHREMVARISRAARSRALAIDYRLAPEHPHPAAVEDAVAAYRWLLGQGVRPEGVTIAGDSAGGGLTVATLVALRDAGEPLPAAGVCLSPWVDLEGSGESMRTKHDVDPMVKLDGLLQFAEMYLGGQHPQTPLAAPLHADLSDLPPLLIQVGTAETLLDDSTRLAARAREAGVDVELDPWDDMVHVWQIFGSILPEAREAIERIGAFVRTRTAPAEAREPSRGVGG